jgi:hypothetical protein
VIASLEQQVHVLQLQVPPPPASPAIEPDVVSDVDEMHVMGCVWMWHSLNFYYFEWVG